MQIKGDWYVYSFLKVPYNFVQVIIFSYLSLPSYNVYVTDIYSIIARVMLC